jgi:hypothetical protein
MKIKLFRHSIILNVIPNKPATALNPATVGTYHSQSRHTVLEISQMKLDWIRNALLKKMNLTAWNVFSSEEIINYLSDYMFPDDETYSLYRELKRRVIHNK